MNNNKYKITHLKSKIMSGGNISWATPEYIENIISSKTPDSSKCDIIKNIVPKINEGRHNFGIGFITIEGKEYFLKYGDYLFEEFKTGYMLQKLKSEYPYFLNVYSLLKCNYIPIGKSESVNSQVMIVEKGGETIYNYLNKHSLKYFLSLIPDLNNRVENLDSSIIKIITENLTVEEIKYYNYQLQENNKTIYEKIILEVSELIKNFYLSLSREIIQFQTEFIPLFIKNYKVLIDSNMIVDIFTLNKYDDYITDKKSDNFMVTTEPYVDGKIHVNVKLGSSNIRINNICEWPDIKEYCFIYPVDFGSANINNTSKLNDELLPYFLNQWICSYSMLKLYSDIDDNNLESKNILSLNGSNIKFNFSSYLLKIDTNINFQSIFDKYNSFAIKIFNPFEIYFEGKISMNDDNVQNLLLNNPLKSDDYRFQRGGVKLFNINNLEKACNILKILLDGNTVKYDNYNNKYASFSNIINFNIANGIPVNYNYFEDENVYKTFYVI